MSAHGGLLGVLIVMALYVRRHGMQFWQLTDFVAPLVPLGLFSAASGTSSMASFGAGQLRRTFRGP